MRRVLARAEQRKARREDTLRRLVHARPEVPQGILATLQRKAHEQALLAWEAGKEAATLLVEQARQLAARLVEAVRPERLAAWAREQLQLGQYGRAAEQVSGGSAKQLATPQPSLRSKPLQRSTLAAYSIEDQYRLYNHFLDQLKVAGQEKVQRVGVKVAKRLERRQNQLSWSEADQPAKPHGLLAAFKKREYEEAVKAYWQRVRHDRTLVEQAAKLQKKVQEASHRSESWAVRKLHSLQPEFVDRVERYVRGHNQQVQMAKLEAQRKLQRVQGLDGPERSR